MIRFFKSNPNSLTDKEMVEKFQQSNDLSLLSTLYDRYLELVYGLALKYFKEDELAKDAVMDIYLLLQEKLKEHKVDNFKSWLYTLAKNHCLSSLRKKRIEIIGEVEPEFMHFEDFMHPLISEGDKTTQLNKLNECIKQLPEKQQNCIRWFYLENLTYKEIAEYGQMEHATVRSYIQNGRRNLKKCMEKNR
ncbi:MAG: sigma-70 family RNA polymerase sigma factor [Bacteroidota bacterium]